MSINLTPSYTTCLNLPTIIATPTLSSATSTPSAPSTPSRNSISPSSSTALLEPPRKRPRKCARKDVDPAQQRLDEVYTMDVEKAWEVLDEELIAAAKSKWTSKVYDHYNWRVVREGSEGSRIIWFVFTCKYSAPQHPPTWQARTKGGTDGTGNMNSNAKTCDNRFGRSSSSTAAFRNSQPYSQARHRALIALRCSSSKRSFNSVSDPFYIEECRFLSGDPSLRLPSLQTVQRDVLRLYEDLGPLIRNHFERRGRSIHVVTDGWSDPTHTSNVGVVIIWEEEAKLRRMLLEIVKITDRHTGFNIAKLLFDCLNRYGLAKFLHLLGMDNASNCDTTARHLPAMITTFRGLPDRLRCFLHAVQLAAKMIISFFDKQCKRKKKVKTMPSATTTAGQPSQRAPALLNTAESDTVCDASSPEDTEDTELREVHEAALEQESEEEAAVRALADAGQSERDTEAVRSVRAQAIQEMRACGIVISEPEARAALKVFPKISGLAIKLSDNAVLRKIFEDLVDQFPPNTDLGNFQYLHRRNATRWDSEHGCLKSHLALEHAVSALTSNADLKLGSFKLTGQEKQLSEDLYDMLDSINQITLHFQGVDVPLIIDVIPAFEHLQKDLKRMSNAPELPAVCRVAAYGGLLMTRKYYQRFGDCEAYVIACVMCPDRKLEWFKKELGWSDDEVKDVRKVVEARFKQTYAQLSRAISRPLPANEPQDLPAPRRARGANRWKSAAETAATPPSDSDADDIEVYLSTPPSVIDYASGATVLSYWDARLKSQPALAHMGLSFTSAPATTVDAEHAFSEGRNQVNWNQEHTSSQTFRAKMSIGAWSKAPWFTVDHAEKILKEKGGPLLK